MNNNISHWWTEWAPARGYIPPTGAQYFREKIYQSIWVEVLLMYGNPSTPDGNPSILMEDLPDVWKSIHPGWKSIHTRHTRWKSIHPRWKSIHPRWKSIHPSWKSIHSIRAKRRNLIVLNSTSDLSTGNQSISISREWMLIDDFVN